MPVKYIRPDNLITNRKTTKLVKRKKFIQEDEYEMKISAIKELLDELDLENFQIDENIKNNYEIFSKLRDEVSNKIDDIIKYIDEIKNEDYDIEQIKAIAKEKIEKEIYERYKIYSNINSKYVYKNLNIEDASKHIINIKYKKKL